MLIIAYQAVPHEQFGALGGLCRPGSCERGIILDRPRASPRHCIAGVGRGSWGEKLNYWRLRLWHRPTGVQAVAANTGMIALTAQVSYYIVDVTCRVGFAALRVSFELLWLTNGLVDLG